MRHAQRGRVRDAETVTERSKLIYDNSCSKILCKCKEHQLHYFFKLYQVTNSFGFEIKLLKCFWINPSRQISFLLTSWWIYPDCCPLCWWIQLLGGIKAK